jgi:hypothetical protein
MFELLRSYNPAHLTAETVALALLLSFLGSAAIAKTYEKTFNGLSWSPGLVQALVLGSVTSCMIMLAIGDNIAGAVGIIGSLAIIRFRTNLRDPRDMVFVFAALGSGVACGLQAFVVALAGAGGFCLVAWALAATGFGMRRSHDGLVRFQLAAGATAATALGAALKEHTAHFALVTMRDVAQGAQVDYAYQIRLARHDPGGERLLAALRGVDGLVGLTYLNQQATVEV